MLSRGLIAAAWCGVAAAFVTGYDYCGAIPHGTYVTDAAPGPYAITVTDSDGNAVATWSPGATYTVKLAAAADAGTLQGFVIAPFASSAAPSSFGATKAGILLPLDAQSRDMGFCDGGCTHTNSALKSSVRFQWTTPATGSSSVTIFAHVVECRYCNGDGLNHRVALTLPIAADSAAASSPVPAASVSPSTSPAVIVAASPAAAASASPSGSSGSHSGTDDGSDAGSETESGDSETESGDSETGEGDDGSSLQPAAASPSPSPATDSQHQDDSEAEHSPSPTPSPAAGGSGTTDTSSNSESDSSDAQAASDAASFPHSVSLSASLTLRWRFVGSDGAPAAAAAGAKRVTFRLEYSSDSVSGSDVWLALGCASCDSMLNSQLPGGCSGPVVMGTPRYNVTKALLLVGRSAEGAVTLPSSAAKVAVSMHTGLLVAGVNGSTTNGGFLQFTRPLALPSRTHASELAISLTEKQGFVWAVGGAPEFGMHRQSGYTEITLGSSATPCSRGATCSGRGTCVRASLKANADEVAASASSGGVCVCDLGYTGASCSSCAAGYSRHGSAASSSAACSLTSVGHGGSTGSDQDRDHAGSGGTSGQGGATGGIGNGTISGSSAGASEDELEVEVTLRLALPFERAGPTNSSERQAFVNTLRAQMAVPLRIPPSRLQVRSLTPGSIIVTVAILPATSSSTTTSSGGSTSAGSSSGGTTTATNATSAPALAELLAQMAADTSSPLYAGNVTGALDSSVPLEFEVRATAAAPPGFSGTASLGSALVLSWHRPVDSDPAADPNLITLRLDYDGSSGDVWFAVGVNSEGKMVGSDVTAYVPSLADSAGASTSSGTITGASGAPAPVQQLVLSALSDVGVRVVDAAAAPFDDMTVQTGTGGAVTVTFTRSMAAGAYPGSRAIPSNGPVTVVYAVGKRGQRSIARHSSNAAGAVQVDFSTGETLAVVSGGENTGRTASITHAVHGTLMFLAWGVLAPVGAFIARFCKRSGSPLVCGKPMWFALHRAVQVTATVLSIGGFVIAVMMTDAEGQFSGLHHIVGVVVFAMGLAQVALAMCRPQPPKPGHQASQLRVVWAGIHTVLGYGTIVLGAAAIFLGLPEAEAADGFTYAYAVLVALGAVAFAVLEAGRCRRPQPMAKSQGHPLASGITPPASAPPAGADVVTANSAHNRPGSNRGDSAGAGTGSGGSPADASGAAAVTRIRSATGDRTAITSTGRTASRNNREDPVALTALSP